MYSYSDIDKKKAQAYIYQNFGYDINEVGSIVSQGCKGEEQEIDEGANSITTNELNHSMQNMEDAF